MVSQHRDWCSFFYDTCAVYSYARAQYTAAGKCRFIICVCMRSRYNVWTNTYHFSCLGVTSRTEASFFREFTLLFNKCVEETCFWHYYRSQRLFWLHSQLIFQEEMYSALPRKVCMNTSNFRIRNRNYFWFSVSEFKTTAKMRSILANPEFIASHLLGYLLISNTARVIFGKYHHLEKRNK